MPSRRGAYAQQILKDYHMKLRLPMILKPPHHLPTVSSTPAITKIGIIGAGISGLYTGLMLDWLNDSKSTYKILEANPDCKRVGGRLYTHHFKNGNTYDYYDVGAMRFPDIPWMKPTTKLFEYLGLPLLDYIMNDKEKNNISFFNGKALSQKEITASIAEGKFDVFGTGLPLPSSPEDIFKSVFGPFKKKLSSDVPEVWQEGLRDLLRYDDWSTRHFVRFRPDRMADVEPGRLAQSIISYLETIDTSTGNYDQAFVESVLDSVDFDTEGTKWKCVDGGADLIAQKAFDMLKQNVEFDKRVTAISPHLSEQEGHIHQVQLTIHGNEKVNYDHVISTMPLGCLSIVDMSKCGLGWKTTWPIRQLHYDASVKVAIRFSKRWWEVLPKRQIGGVSSTDRPTRIVVYPSYGIQGPAATMIVSYTWAQDALRIGSGVNNSKGTLSPEILEAIFRDLTDMHDIKDENGVKDYTLLPNLMVEHHAWDWCADPFSMGAFALFGPSQFTHLYPQLTRPAFGRLHFAGEATSVHHAWVVGALYSAFRCLSEVFQACNRQDLINKLKGQDSPFASAGVEDNEVSQELVNIQVALGQDHGKKLAKTIRASPIGS